MDEYTKQVEDFLAKHEIKLDIKLSNTKGADWDSGSAKRNHYRVTVTCDNHHEPRHMTFDFWGSINDAANKVHPSSYDVLACLGSESHCPNTIEEFASDFGYDVDTDSIKERNAMEKAFDGISDMAHNCRHVFNQAALDDLRDIQ